MKRMSFHELGRIAAVLTCFATAACTPSRPSSSLVTVQQALRRAKSPQILWIGNSYSFDAPREFERLARQRGCQVHCSQVTHNGWTLARHARNPATIAAIRSRHWDVVVLQEQSRRPSLRWQLYGQSLPAARTLAHEIRRVGAQPVLFQTWGYRDGDPTRRGDDFTAMHRRLSEGYATLSRHTHAPVIPVGERWQIRMQSADAPELYQPDGSHPSPAGVQLIAKTFISSMLINSR